MPSSAPFNHIVTWTWHLLALAAILFYYGRTLSSPSPSPSPSPPPPSSSSSSSSHAPLGALLLLSAAYALGGGVAASNACVAVRFARGEDEAFGVCDLVGAAVGAAVEDTVVGARLTDEDWARVGRASEGLRWWGSEGVVETVGVAVDRVVNTRLRRTSRGWEGKGGHDVVDVAGQNLWSGH